MSETTIYSILVADGNITGLVSTRIYPILAPQNTTNPYIVYRRISGVSINALEGELGTTEGRFQIDAYSTSYAEAKTLAGYVKAALKASSSVRGALISDVDFEKEQDTNLYRVSMDFRYWFLE